MCHTCSLYLMTKLLLCTTTAATVSPLLWSDLPESDSSIADLWAGRLIVWNLWMIMDNWRANRALLELKWSKVHFAHLRMQQPSVHWRRLDPWILRSVKKFALMKSPCPTLNSKSKTHWTGSTVKETSNWLVCPKMCTKSNFAMHNAYCVFIRLNLLVDVLGPVTHDFSSCWWSLLEKQSR